MSQQQGSFDYAALARQAEIRRARGEDARVLSAQLSAVPAELVGLGPHQWEQVQQWLFWLALTGSPAEAARLGGFSKRQFTRIRARGTRLRLVAVAPQFGEAGRRIEDRVTIDHARVSELAELARRLVRRRQPHESRPDHVSTTSGPPVDQVPTTSRPPPDHVLTTFGPRLDHRENSSGDTARACAGARVLSRRLDESTRLESIDRCMREWKRDDWEAVKAATIGVTRSEPFHGPKKRREDVEFVLKMNALVRAGCVPETLFEGCVDAVRATRRVRKPFAYLTTCCLEAAAEEGIHLKRCLARVRLPAWLLPRD